MGRHWADVTEHVPLSLARQARAAARDAGARVLVALGGGSAIGLAKAVAVGEGLPLVAIPTTYAGSASTSVWATSDEHGKTTRTSPEALPGTVVLDASLTLGLPRHTSLASGLNAVAHCVDAMWGPATTPVTRMTAVEGARLLGPALRRLAEDQDDVPAREDALLGAHLAGVALDLAGAGVHHKLCHVVAGRHGLPHAATHAIVLPHVAAVCLPSLPDGGAALAAALGTSPGDPARTIPTTLRRLARVAGVPAGLAELGMPESAIGADADAVADTLPTGTPPAVDRDALHRVVADAWAGATDRTGPTMGRPR